MVNEKELDPYLRVPWKVVIIIVVVLAMLVLAWKTGGVTISFGR